MICCVTHIHVLEIELWVLQVLRLEPAPVFSLSFLQGQHELCQILKLQSLTSFFYFLIKTFVYKNEIYRPSFTFHQKNDCKLSDLFSRLWLSHL